MLKKLFKESLVYGLSRYIGKFIGVFLLPLYTAVLSPEDYGILDLLGTISIVSTFLIVSGTDAALGYYYYRKEYFEERPLMLSSALWLRLIFSIVIFVAVLASSSILSNILFGRDYQFFVMITAVTILFNAVFSFINDLLRFEFRPWLYTIISSGSILLNILLTIYFVLILERGVFGALIASMIAYSVLFAVTLIYVFGKYGVKISWKWMKNILLYGFPLIGTGIAVWILNSTDRYFLAYYVDLSSVGIYSVGMKLAGFLGMIAGAIQMAWGPFAMEIQYREDAKKIYSKVFLLFMVINILGVFIISMFSIDILKVFTQPNYYSAKAVVPFLCYSIVLTNGYFIVVIGIHITKKLQHTIWITIVAALTNIGLNFLLTPWLGVIGASFSILIANLVIFILTLIISQRHYYIPFSYFKILVTFIPSAIIITITYYFDLRLIPRIIISMLFLSIAGVYFYNILKNSEEYRKLYDMMKKFKLRKNNPPPEDFKSSEP